MSDDRTACNAEHPEQPGVFCERTLCVEVPLTQGYVVLIDQEDADSVLRSSWSVLKLNGRVYAKAKIQGRLVTMHRLIMGEPEGLDVDHADGNGLNNRRSNLRLSTRGENNANGRARTDGKSRFKGVSWHAQLGKWQVHIQKNRNRRYVGVFSCEEDAARAYDRVARELHGQFARTNESLGLFEGGS